MSKIIRVAVKGSCYRVIPSKYPTIDLFDDVAESEDFEDLYELQALTNPRLKLACTTKNNYISSPFAHLNPAGSRFSDGSFGVFYAGESEEVCIAETHYHTTKFMLETKEPAQDLDMRMIVAHLNARLHNLSGKQKLLPSYYYDTNYSHSQAYGLSLFAIGADGIRYSSVRHSAHHDAYAVFNMDVLSRRARQSKHLVYSWDGNAISNTFEKLLINS